jgi:hypothetical protein
MPVPTPAERDEEIIRGLEEFNSTGSVKNLSLIGFDQNGKWIGMRRFSDNQNFPEKLTKKVRKLKVPIEVLISTNEDGKRLEGSYVADTEEPLTIDFAMISGNLIVRSKSNADFHAPYLTDVVGKVEIMSANVNMPSLLCTADFIVLLHTETLNIPKLTYALRCVICPFVSEFNAPELLFVKGDFMISNAAHIHLPNLTGIERHFMAGGATTLIAPKLETVGGILDSSSARDFYMPGLKSDKWLMHPDAEKLFAAKALKRPPIIIE